MGDFDTDLPLWWDKARTGRRQEGCPMTWSWRGRRRRIWMRVLPEASE
jgi:hypothetical protein